VRKDRNKFYPWNKKMEKVERVTIEVARETLRETQGGVKV
jgi:hypothetical protein